MKLDKNKFDKLVEQKLVTCRVHPRNSDLFIYNYTPEVQFEKKWDKLTMMCRGLILQGDGTLVSRPFSKFFNLGETKETTIANLPSELPEVSEKLDGSLGILYEDESGYSISTRGSFESEQAIWATDWLKRQGDKDWRQGITYLFEIIYPTNRIVVDYKSRAELVMVGLVKNDTGEIFPYDAVVSEADRLGLSYPKLFKMSLKEIQEKAKNSKDNEEGFVLFYPKAQLMVKVKLEDYVRLHRLTFGISIKAIWENMAEGKNIEAVFKDAPDEVFDWIKKYKDEFKEKELKHLTTAKKLYDEVIGMETRKEQALYLQANNNNYLSIVFSMIDNKKNYMKQIYNFFRPSAEDSTKTFKYVKEENL